MVKNNYYVSKEIIENCVDPALLIETINKARHEPNFVFVPEESDEKHIGKAESEGKPNE